MNACGSILLALKDFHFGDFLSIEGHRCQKIGFAHFFDPSDTPCFVPWRQFSSLLLLFDLSPSTEFSSDEVNISFPMTVSFWLMIKRLWHLNCNFNCSLLIPYVFSVLLYRRSISDLFITSDHRISKEKCLISKIENDCNP